MTPGFELSADALASHGQFLRRLARELVGEGPEADDLEQEVWLAALRRAPGEIEHPRGWLTRTLRHARLRGLRTRGRSREREERAARAEALPSSEELAQRMEMSRSLADAVLALPEPVRTAVHLHYAEGLSVREIARRADAPIETVRSRVKRGLALLRERLDADCQGDRERWCLALAPFMVIPPHKSIGLGVWVMSSWKILSAGCVAALMLVAAVYEGTEDPLELTPTEALEVSVEADSERTALAGLSLEESTTPPPPATDDVKREEAPAIPDSAPPVEDEETWDADDDSSDHADHSDLLAALGYVSDSPPSQNASGRVVGRVSVDGELPVIRELRIHESESTRLCVPGERIDPRDPRLAIGPHGGIADVVVTLHTSRTAPRGESPPAWIEIENGRFKPHLTLLQPGQKLRLRNHDFDLHTVVFEGGESVTPDQSLAQGDTTPPLALSQTASPTLILRDPSCPWMHAVVLVTEAPFVTKTDELGHFEFDDIPPGTYKVGAWHAELGKLKVKSKLRVEEGREFGVTIAVQDKELRRSKAVQRR